MSGYWNRREEKSGDGDKSVNPWHRPFQYDGWTDLSWVTGFYLLYNTLQGAIAMYSRGPFTHINGHTINYIGLLPYIGKAHLSTYIGLLPYIDKPIFLKVFWAPNI